MGKVKTKWIEDFAITNTKIADNAITEAKVVDSAITNTKIADGSITFDKINTSTIGTSMYQISRGDHTHPSPSGFYANILINGDFNVAQRGRSFSQIDNNSYPLDCWYYHKSGDMECSSSQHEDAPTVQESGHHSKYSLELTSTQSHTTTSTDDICYIAQGIEGSKFNEYVGLEMILTFWVNSSRTGTYCISFTNNIDESCVVEYQIIQANTWELKAITIPISVVGSNWNTTNGLGLMIAFVLQCGSDYHTSTPGSWNQQLAYGTSNQVDFTQNVGEAFHLSQVQLKRGDGITIFQGLHFPVEYQLCQRYYEKTYSHINAPGTATTEGVLPFPYLTPNISSWAFPYKVEKRVNPTIIFYDMNGNVNCLSGIDSTGVIVDNLDILDNTIWRTFDIIIGRTGMFLNHRSKYSSLFTYYLHYELEAYLI